MSPKVFLSLLLLLGPAFGHAESITELIGAAMRTNPELKFYETEVAAARAGKQTAGQLANPELGIEFSSKRTGSTSASGENGVVWRAELAQTFDFPGRIALRKAIADRDIGLAQLGLLQFKSLLGNQVRKLAGDLSLLRKQATATRAVRERLAELIGVLVQRDTGNISAKLERRILEASLLTNDHTLTEVTKEADRIATTLNLLCGRAPDAGLQVANEPVELPPAPTLAALKERAAMGNFELQQKRVQLARQGLKIDLTKSERWGNIKFGPYLASENLTEDHERQAGIIFSVPLPLWNQNKGNIAAEQARQLGAQAMLAATLRDLERDLTVQHQGYVAELEALSHWQPETENEFKTAAEEADHHYRLGAVNAATYVEMQRGYLDALSALIESRRHAWEHRMELERLTGSSLESKQ
jgi:cobalt-zinc-cadmium efflux system outer membrane protein